MSQPFFRQVENSLLPHPTYSCDALDLKAPLIVNNQVYMIELMRAYHCEDCHVFRVETEIVSVSDSDYIYIEIVIDWLALWGEPNHDHDERLVFSLARRSASLYLAQHLEPVGVSNYWKTRKISLMANAPCLTRRCPYRS